MSEYEIGEGDEFWLVLDCDHWVSSGHIKNLARVMRECRQKGIRIALSQPCFELWLLLHFTDFPTENALTRSQIEKRIRAAAGSYDKTTVYNLPLNSERVKAAVQRSRANQSATSEIPNKPQTGVQCIIEDLLARGIISME